MTSSPLCLSVMLILTTSFSPGRCRLIGACVKHLRFISSGTPAFTLTKKEGETAINALVATKVKKRDSHQDEGPVYLTALKNYLYGLQALQALDSIAISLLAFHLCFPNHSILPTEMSFRKLEMLCHCVTQETVSNETGPSMVYVRITNY